MTKSISVILFIEKHIIRKHQVFAQLKGARSNSLTLYSVCVLCTLAEHLKLGFRIENLEFQSFYNCLWP